MIGQKGVYGKTSGLKASQWTRLERLLRRKVSPHQIISPELAKELCHLSWELHSQVGILINRKGDVTHVIVGPDDEDLYSVVWGTGERKSRFRGLRYIHTHLTQGPLSEKDLTHAILLSLDIVCSIEVLEDGIPGRVRYAYVLPNEVEGMGLHLETVSDVGRLNTDFLSLMQALEQEFEKNRGQREIRFKDRAVLVAARQKSKEILQTELEELEALAISDEIEVVDKVIQVLKEPDPKFFIKKGKLNEVVLRALRADANLIIFGSELSPAQLRNLTDHTDLKVIDRTQLILDIFARRATTREGKIQVELAQLRYMLPRLGGKGTAFSRLTGGIGGRGPGETKLEIDKRRVKERIFRLTKELKEVREQRALRRSLRREQGIPIISIVGYTNAGKSTLLNSLTKSSVGARDRLFETLDPTSRRLKFPKEREVIITDTVGFIQDLPKDLLDAFSATLEELKDANLILHVADISHPRLEEHIKVVEDLMVQLGLGTVPRILVLNKVDKLDPEMANLIAMRYKGRPVSALEPVSLLPLITDIQKALFWEEEHIPLPGPCPEYLEPQFV